MTVRHRRITPIPSFLCQQQKASTSCSSYHLHRKWHSLEFPRLISNQSLGIFVQNPWQISVRVRKISQNPSTRVDSGPRPADTALYLSPAVSSRRISCDLLCQGFIHNKPHAHVKKSMFRAAKEKNQARPSSSHVSKHNMSGGGTVSSRARAVSTLADDTERDGEFDEIEHLCATYFCVD